MGAGEGCVPKCEGGYKFKADKAKNTCDATTKKLTVEAECEVDANACDVTKPAVGGTLGACEAKLNAGASCVPECTATGAKAYKFKADKDKNTCDATSTKLTVVAECEEDANACD